MRPFVGGFGLIGGAIVVALVGRYGFVTADSEIDGYIAAFLFGTIALGGLAGHAVAARLWETSHRAAWVVGIVATVALLVNLTNSLGAIASRGDKQIAERTKSADGIKDARAELKRIQRDRDAMPAFSPTTAEAVEAAKSAVDAAEKAREQECGKVGPFCRQRVADETARRSELSKAIADKALTDQTAKLEKDAEAQRTILSSAAPVHSVNPHAAALARLLRLPDTAALTAATWQQFAVAVIVELLIAVAFVAFELLRDERSRGAEPERAQPTQARAVVPPPPRGREISLLAAVRRPAARPRAAEPAAREIDADPIIAFLKEHVPPARGEQADWGMIYGHFLAWCEGQRIEPYPSSDFGAALAFICKEAGIRTRSRAGRVYCVDRKVMPVGAG